MRSQVYEWANMSAVVGTASLQRTVGDLVSPVAANTSSDIFIGGIGNNITKPAETTATQFIVIEDVSCSPWIGGSVQVRINTTDYFQNPDVTQMNGVPGLASPYPRGCPTSQVTAAGVTTYTPDNLLKSFDLYPDVYVLPGQVFQILYTPTLGTNDVSVTDAGNIVVMAFIVTLVFRIIMLWILIVLSLFPCFYICYKHSFRFLIHLFCMNFQYFFRKVHKLP